jgi:hypothetical protein
MAQGTVELGRLLDKTNFELFDFDYQFDDQAMKAQIEEHIIEYYYDYEIGFETPDMFKRKFKARFNRLIPFYNKLYNTTLLSYNPLINSKMTEALDQLATTVNTRDELTTRNNTRDELTTDKDTGTVGVVMHSDGTAVLDKLATKGQNELTTVVTDGDKNTKGTDYPQQPIAGGVYLKDENLQTVNETNTTTGDIDTTENEDSTTTSTDDSTATTTNDLTKTIDGLVTDSGTTDGLVTTNDTYNNDFTKTIEGLTGITYQELIMKERELIINIPVMIINDLKPCFMLTF